MAVMRGLMSPHQIQEDMVVQYATQGGEAIRRKNPTSIGYIQEGVYDITKPGKPLLHFIVFPVMHVDQATQTGRPSFILDPGKIDTQRDLGLPPGQWAIVIDPNHIHPDDMGRRKDNLVTALGDLRQTAVYEDFQDMAERYLLRSIQDAPKFAERNPDNLWGVYIPLIKKGKNALDGFETTDAGAKKPLKGKKSNQQGGAQLNISVENAIKAGVLDEGIANLLMKPEDGRVKPILSLREAFTIADKSPDDLLKYAPKKLDLEENVPLKSLEGHADGQIHPTIVWGLSSPREGKKGEGAVPVIDLKSAYDLVTQSPEKLSKYNYLGKVLQEKALEQIPEAYKALAKSLDNQQHFSSDLVKVIKQAWKAVSNTYASTLNISGQTPAPVPENFKDESGKALWSFEKR